DGIRDDLVTGVQTCALPICSDSKSSRESGCRAQRWRARATHIAPGSGDALSPASESGGAGALHVLEIADAYCKTKSGQHAGNSIDVIWNSKPKRIREAHGHIKKIREHSGCHPLLFLGHGIP